MAKNVSAEFKNIIKSGGPFYAYAVVTLRNGKRLVLDSDQDFYISGNKYVEDGGGGFPLGSAISKSITLVIDNIDERYSEYDFYYAQISLYTEADVRERTYDSWRDMSGTEILDVDGNRIILTDTAVERPQEGIFTIIEPVAVGDTIELTGYDYMYKADTEFESKLTYPTTARQLLREVCSFCGILLGSPEFPNDTFEISQAPEKTTGRNIIGYIAQLAVGNAIIQNGTLIIRSYDFSAIANISDATKPSELQEDAGYHILEDFQDDPDIGTDMVTITGIATIRKGEKEDIILLNGTDDYALNISNPLIEGNEDEALQLIGDVLIGIKIRPFSGELLPNPTIEFMDLVCVVDRKDHVYGSFITSHEFEYLGGSSLSCGVKSPERQKSTYYSEATKIYQNAKKDIARNKTEFEQAVENLNKTIENASGMYTTEEAQPDGSTITYLHDKRTLEESMNVIKITADAIGISTDGGKTFPYGLFLTGDLITRILYSIGINADYVNTGALTIKDKDGNITFYADTDTGRVTINAESLNITGKSIQEISNSIVQNFVENIYKTDLDEIKKQLSNKIETWYQDTDPSVNWDKITEVVWCDVDGYPILDSDGNKILTYYEESKAEHEGDLWYNTDTKEKWMYKSGQWVPEEIPDTVFDEIDGKSSIYINTPTTPYKERDLWFKDGKILVCKESKSTGECNTDDWVKKDEYTDDSKVTDFIQNTYTPKIQEMQEQIDGKVESFFFDYEPTLENYPANKWTTEEERLKHNADTFYWKTKKSTYIFCKIDGVWQWLENKDPDIKKAMEAAAAAKDTADGKRRTFVTTPVPPYDEGDLWTQGDKGDLMCCKVSRLSGNYVSSDWGKATKYTDNSALDKFNEELNQSEIFNRLTNNGTEQGIFLKDGKIYINFSYAEGGTLKLGGKDNVNGTLVILDLDGNEIGNISNNGVSLIGDFTNKSKYFQYVYELKIANGSMIYNRNDGEIYKLSRDELSYRKEPNGDYVFRASRSTGVAVNLLSVMNGITSNGAIYANDNVTVVGDFLVRGEKNRIVNTENYASRLQYCYEMPSPMFGDIGEGCTDDSGVCIVAIDDIFRETVTDGPNYHVFLQKEGPGDIWIENKTDSYFIVKGTKNMKFSWEIKAKQKGYEFERLECYKESENDEEYINYEDVGYYTYTKYVNDLELGGEEV